MIRFVCSKTHLLLIEALYEAKWFLFLRLPMNGGEQTPAAMLRVDRIKLAIYRRNVGVILRPTSSKRRVHGHREGDVIGNSDGFTSSSLVQRDACGQLGNGPACCTHEIVDSYALSLGIELKILFDAELSRLSMLFLSSKQQIDGK